jgi:hypothetical protein
VAAREAELGVADAIVLDVASLLDPCAHCCLLLAANTAAGVAQSLFGRTESMLRAHKASLTTVVRRHVRASGLEKLEETPARPPSRTHVARHHAAWTADEAGTRRKIVDNGYIPSFAHEVQT